MVIKINCFKIFDISFENLPNIEILLRVRVLYTVDYRPFGHGFTHTIYDGLVLRMTQNTSNIK